MNFEQLRSFQAVATRGGFSRAAETLYLTQSTISMQVASLEKELGVRLFERLGRRVVPTHAGEIMLGYSSRILSMLEASRQSMMELRGLDTGELRIGASLTVGNYLLPELLGDFRDRHPGIRLVLDIAPTAQIAKGVASGSLDLGMVEAGVDDDHLKARPFFVDELVLIVPRQHPWAGRDAVGVEELVSEPFIEREPGSGTRAIVRQRLFERGLTVKPVLEMGSPEAIKSAVRAGLGVAIVSKATVTLEVRAGLLMAPRLEGISMTRPFLVVLHRDKQLRPALEAFLEMVSQQFGSTPRKHRTTEEAAQ